MLYIIHTLAGILIASKFNSIWIVAVLALISHFLLDMIPHRDSLFKREDFNFYKIKISTKSLILEIADALVSILLIILFYIQFQNKLIIIAVFFSLLPDIVKIFYFTPVKKLKIFQKYINFHIRIQTETSWALGILIQLIIAGIILIILEL